MQVYAYYVGRGILTLELCETSFLWSVVVVIFNLTFAYIVVSSIKAMLFVLLLLYGVCLRHRRRRDTPLT